MNVYEIITNRIIEKLNQGTIPWQRPWNVVGGRPQNLVSKKEYRGINVFMLLCSGFSSPYWLTFNQVNNLGGQVKAGAKATPVVFWKLLKPTAGEAPKTGTEKEEGIPILRYYSVFNADQCECLQLPVVEKTEPAPFNPIPACEKIVDEMPNRPKIEHVEAQAYYRLSADTINMPQRGTFVDEEGYYSTLFHELTHATGHEGRLNRKTIVDLCPFGSTNYSREELVAEMGAAFLCGVSGIENKTIDSSAAYISSWIHRLHDDKKLVVTAAAQAQKAADFILRKNFQEDPA